MIPFRDLLQTFRSFPVPGDQPVLVHTSPSFPGTVQGGERSVLGALKQVFRALMMPSFTYQTMVFPKTGPKDNGVEYNNPPRDNRKAVFYHPQLEVSPQLGDLPETFRCLPDVARSSHPILSFSGINTNHALEAQTVTDPYAPLSILLDQGGWVLLLGTDQRKNFSIHYALHQAGRKLFTRWALTPAGIKPCPHYPGCPEGFNDLQVPLLEHNHIRQLEKVEITAIPLQSILQEVKSLLNHNPLALLCDQEYCLRCSSIRARES